MELAIALSFNIRPDEAIVSRTISMIPPDRREEWIIRQARERPAAERAAFLDGVCAGDEASYSTHRWNQNGWFCTYLYTRGIFVLLVAALSLGLSLA